MTADLSLVQAIDIIFRARQEECEYLAAFRVNPRVVRDRTVSFYVDHASMTVAFRSEEPRTAGDEPRNSAALDGIGIDREFLVSRRDADEHAMFCELVGLALAWWFDEFERYASPITRANAALIKTVVETALADSPEEPMKNHTAAARRFAWREVAGARFTRPL